MLAKVLLLALAVLDTATASAQQCKSKQLGKYAPLSSDRATQKYCSSYLHGKAPRGIEQRNGQTTTECLRSDLKKEKKSYQSAICSCFVPLTTSTTRSSTKCTTKTTKSTTTSKKTTTSKTTTSSTTTSAAPAPTCTQNQIITSGFCRFTQSCDQEIVGGLLQPQSQQPDENSCLALCSGINGAQETNESSRYPCRGYNYNTSTRACELLSTITDINPAQGTNSGQVMGCCQQVDANSCGQQR